MTSDQFLKWLERKLTEHGINKVVPEDDILASAYRRAIYLQRIEDEVEKVRPKIAEQSKSIELPDNLSAMVREQLEDEPDLSWDEAMWRIAGEGGQ